MKVESRKVSDSRVETVHIVRPNHLNAAGRLFGGMLMQWIDEVAALVAKRHTHTNVTTASVDNLSFLKGAYPGDSVVIIGQLVYVGRTSMDIKVDSYVESMDGTRTLINHAYLTVVARFQCQGLNLQQKMKPQNGKRQNDAENLENHCNFIMIKEIRELGLFPGSLSISGNHPDHAVNLCLLFL